MSLVDVYEASTRRFTHRDAIGERHDGEWLWSSYDHLRRLIDECRGGLAALGVQPGDRVALVADNRLEWAVTAYATYGLGAALVPMHVAQVARERAAILADSGARVLLAAGDGPYEDALAALGALPSLERVIGLDLPAEHPDGFRHLLGVGDGSPAPVLHPPADALASLLYTSGTTGAPKGAEMTHGNLQSNLEAMREVFPLDPDERSLAILPWAHAFGQTCELHYGLGQGIAIAINGSPARLLDDLGEVSPTILVVVPQVLNRIHDEVHARVAGRSAIIRKVFRDGLATAEKHAAGERGSWLGELELSIDERLIFAGVRAELGGALRRVICGAAALDPHVAALIEAIGIEVYEGFGLTEAGPVVSANTPAHRRRGSAGRPLPGVRVRIDRRAGDGEEGEIVVYGPSVMRGYHGRPRERRAALTDDGGLRTGDLGYLDEDGYLFVTGRLEERYELSNGERVVPAPVEDRLSTSPFIKHAVLYGRHHPYNVAVVSCDKGALLRWAEAEGVETGDLVRSHEVRALIEGECLRLGRDLRPYEVPAKALVVDEELTTRNGLLTPTLKVRRDEVVRRYRSEIAGLYLEPLRP